MHQRDSRSVSNTGNRATCGAWSLSGRSGSWVRPSGARACRHRYCPVRWFPPHHDAMRKLRYGHVFGCISIRSRSLFPAKSLGMGSMGGRSHRSGGRWHRGSPLDESAESLERPINPASRSDHGPLSGERNEASRRLGASRTVKLTSYQRVTPTAGADAHQARRPLEVAPAP